MTNSCQAMLPEYSELDIRTFSRVFNDNNQGYKFFWFKSILNLATGNHLTLIFDDIINDMLADAWYMITMYHLKIGPRRIPDKSMNYIEIAVNQLNEYCSLSPNASKKEIIQAIKKYDEKLSANKNKLTDNVPYRFLTPFIGTSIAGNSKDHYRIEQINKINTFTALPYTITKTSNSLQYLLIINPQWY